MSEQSTSSMSLHGFCKQFDLSKTTVHRYCKENDIPTSSGLSAEAVERLKVAFNITEPLKSPQKQVSAASAVVHVPQSSIEVLNPESVNVLDVLHTQLVKPQRFQSVEMNGTGETLVSLVVTLHGQVEGMKSANDEAETNLDQREATLDKVTAVARQLGKAAQSEMNRNEKIAEKAEDVKAKEEALKKLLESLQL